MAGAAQTPAPVADATTAVLGVKGVALRLVVPGDKRLARWVKMLKTISVVKVGE